MAVRHRLCTALATAVRELGYMGDMGYNQLLYPNERDTRRVLSWLAAKLPRPEEDSGSGGGHAAAASFSGTLLRGLKGWIGGSGSSAQAAGPSPPASPGLLATPLDAAVARGVCRSQRRDGLAAALKQQGALARALAGADSAGAEAAAGASAALAATSLLPHLATRSWPSLCAVAAAPGSDTGAAPHRHVAADTAVAVAAWWHGSNAGAAVGGAASVAQSAAPLEAIVDSRRAGGGVSGGRQAFASSGDPRASARLFPGTFADAHPSAFTRACAFAARPPASGLGAGGRGGLGGGAADGAGRTEEEVAAEREAELAALQAQLEAVLEGIARLQQQHKLLLSSIPGIEGALADTLERTGVLERQFLVRRACLDMLPEAERHIASMTAEIAESGSRLLALAEEWEAHRLPLVTAVHEALEGSAKRSGETERLRASLADMRGTLGGLAASAASKEAEIERLTAEYAKLQEALSESAAHAAGGDGESAAGGITTRPNYTRRIMDIIRQIRKQKAEIGRIVRDVRAVQLEINAGSDKLQRTLAVAGETMERAAVEQAKDGAYRQVLRQLLTLQELFQHLISATTALGHFENELRTLDNRIEQLGARNDGNNMAQLLRDLGQVQTDNASLEAALAGSR